MSASRAGRISFERVPLRPSACLSRRLWRRWAGTPRLTRATTDLQVREQPADLRGVRGPDDGLARVATLPAGRLDLEVVAAPRLDAHDLARAGHAEALGRALVGLHLGHLIVTPRPTPGPPPPRRLPGAFLGAPWACGSRPRRSTSRAPRGAAAAPRRHDP